MAIGEKNYALLNSEQIVCISPVIITINFFLLLLLLLLLLSVSFVLISGSFLECGVSSEVPSDGDLLWLLLCGW